MKFQALYPTEESQSIAIELWSQHLQEFTDHEISQALNACPDHFQWVPEIAEFKDLCRNFKSRREKDFHVRPLEIANATFLERSEEAKKARDEIRSIVKKIKQGAI